MPTARRAHRRPLFVLITSNKVVQNSILHKINFISTTISSGEQRLSANSPWKHITHTSFGRLWCALMRNFEIVVRKWCASDAHIQKLWCALMRNSEIVVRKWCAWLILLRKWCAYSKLWCALLNIGQFLKSGIAFGVWCDYSQRLRWNMSDTFFWVVGDPGGLEGLKLPSASLVLRLITLNV